jgi:cellulose/xylan binding protein with CBM9 domain
MSVPMMFVALAASLPPAAGEVPEAHVKKAAGEIKIDGKLDEAAWKGASVVKLRGADGKKDAGHATSVKILWDENSLYLAFECQDPDIWTAHRGRDSFLWTEDVVEAFIDVDPSEPGYVELEVSPRGDLFDGLFLAHRTKVLMSWNPEIRVAVSVDGTVDRRDDVDRSWTVEMAIPVADLAPAPKVGAPGAEIKPGTAWRINFYRNEVSGKDAAEAQAWAPVKNDFHAPELFGKIVFE